MKELPLFLISPFGEIYQLLDGFYKYYGKIENGEIMRPQLSLVPTNIDNRNDSPKWLPDHPEPVWHDGLQREVKIVGIQSGGSILLYQFKLYNSADSTVRLASENQLRELKEVEKNPEYINGKLCVNKAPYSVIVADMSGFISAFPINADDRKKIDNDIKRKTNGLATSVIQERQNNLGGFSGKEDFVNRLKPYNESFPWAAYADNVDFSYSYS
jgi:hypothetical protein